MFHYNDAEISQEHNSCFYQLTYGKLGFITYSLKVAEAIDVNWGLTTQITLKQGEKNYEKLVLYALFGADSEAYGLHATGPWLKYSVN